MRILFVTLPESPHGPRQIRPLLDQGWDVHVFPIYEAPLLPAFRDVTTYAVSAARPPGVDRSVRIRGLWPLRRGGTLASQALASVSRRWASRAEWLALVIRRLAPDVVHSHTVVPGGALTLAARQLLVARHGAAARFPPWIVANWGIDLHLWGRFPEHAATVREVLAHCDYYACECERDVELARRFGFEGQTLPVAPIGGGFDLARLRPLRAPGPTSARRWILLKGYQGLVGRALVALRALEQCGALLEGYRLAVYLAAPEVQIAATLLARSTGIPVEIIPKVPHEEMLRWHGRARVSIGLSLSDAISTSFLEALIMGAFPVQSRTGCASEWATHGEGALFVSPDDPDEVAAALRRALTDDALVDRGAALNARVAAERLDHATNSRTVVDAYRAILARRRQELQPAPALRTGGAGQARKRRGRILLVVMPDSIHVARWTRVLAAGGWDVHLFPAYGGQWHRELRDVTVYSLGARRPLDLDPGVRVRGLWPLRRGAGLAHRVADRAPESWRLRARMLAWLVRWLRPDVVHSHELQHAAYLTLDAIRHVPGRFPPWVVTNWGSDIYLFGRLPDHADRIRAVLARCDFYACECERDVGLAREFGFPGTVLPVVPIGAGFDLARLAALREPVPPSRRRWILLKGYQGWAGRALVGLHALERCAGLLGGFRLAIYLAAPEVRVAATLLSQSTGMPVEHIPPVRHEEMLRWQGRARVHIGLSISDAISTSFLEALVMGAFPVQSDTGCAKEWAREGEGALFVHPDDPAAVAAALRRALTEDDLVDRAAAVNARTAAERLDQSVIAPRILELYERVRAASGRRPGRAVTPCAY